MFKKGKISFELVCLAVAVCFLGSLSLVHRENTDEGQPQTEKLWLETAEAAVHNLPRPNMLLKTSKTYSNPVLKGIKINPQDPFKLEFIIDTEDKKDVTEEELSTLIKYFLAALTIPEEDLWVNLSPYEKDRILPDSLSLTDLGKDLLGQDYLLKQLTSSLMYPDSPIGKKYWDKTYKEVYKLTNTTNIPINTFNKTWIVPDKATVYENDGVALITEARLKVLSEEDYLAFAKQKTENIENLAEKINKISQEALKETILPELEYDVNHGENFSKLRQMYNSLVLAAWFKKKLKNSIYKYYIDQGKTKGINLNDPTAKEKIYNLYVKSFKKGVYDYIKTDYEPGQRTKIKRRYHSGGINHLGIGNKLKTILKTSSIIKNSLKKLLLTTVSIGILSVAVDGLIEEIKGNVQINQSYGMVVPDLSDPRQHKSNQNKRFASSAVKLKDLSLPDASFSEMLYPTENKKLVAPMNTPNLKQIILLPEVGMITLEVSSKYQNSDKEQKLVEEIKELIKTSNKLLIIVKKIRKKSTYLSYFVWGLIEAASQNNIIEGIVEPKDDIEYWSYDIVDSNFFNIQTIKHKKQIDLIVAMALLTPADLLALGPSAIGSICAIDVPYFREVKEFLILAIETYGKINNPNALAHIGEFSQRIDRIWNIMAGSESPSVDSENFVMIPDDTTGEIQHIVSFVKADFSLQAAKGWEAKGYQLEDLRKAVRKALGSSALKDNYNVSSDNIKGGIDLDPVDLNIGAASSAVGFENVSFEAIRQFRASSGLTFKILGMQRGVKIESIVDIEEDKEISYLSY